MICRKKMFRGPLWAVVLAILAGCGSVDFDRPLSAKVGWYGYLNGDDIRNDCRAGSGFHYRLTYNADYREHVRTYNVIDDGADGAFLISRVSEGQGLDISRIFGAGEANLSGWTRWQRSESLGTVHLIKFDHPSMRFLLGFGSEHGAPQWQDFCKK